MKRLGATADTIVLVDVLSFTTAVDIATASGRPSFLLASGATIFPFGFGDDNAADYAAEQKAVLAGSRDGDGFSLSPSSLTRIDPGTRLVLPSPNGAELSLLAESLDRTVVAACLRNAGAVAKGLMSRGTIAVIAAGERWDDGSLRPAVEDLLGAGAVIASTPAKSRSPEAEVAASAFLATESHLGETLREAMSGRELIDRGFAADVELAADLNASTTFPLVIQGFFSSP
ncbi:MAG: 2-phosphosulfolactate phosphatase [Acidimicrobiia bacterium]